MKKITLLFILAFIIQITAFSQSCLPDGITFSTQAEIDNFQTNYPGCTEIEGDVEINGEDINNLNGLSVLTTIGGYLQIGDYHFSTNLDMTSLAGLENLTSIGGDLVIRRNNSLINLTELENITSIEGELRIVENFSLTGLTGLHNITSIAGNLWIDCNFLMNNLSGLNNLTYIGEELWIQLFNLTNLNGLNNLTSIGGNLSIISCYDLLSLSGLENLISIGGGLRFSHVLRLPNFSGLDNLTSIGDFFSLYNNSCLTNLTGLENLTSIGGKFSITKNNSLTSLTALNNLTSIEGELFINNNNVLVNLAGLDNINAESISNLTIYDNPLLSTCEVQSVCDYLSSPNGDINIHDNATGCNSQEEVEYACGVWIPSINSESKFSIYPNPTENEIFISGKEGRIIKEINIYNQLGQKVISENRMTNTIDVSKLRQGIYVIELVSNNSRIREKLIIR